jgi:hypothetical protein
MVLDPIALEHRDGAVVAVNRAGNGDRPFRHQDAVALVHGYFEMVGDDAELVHRHVEHRTGIDGHRSLLYCRTLRNPGQRSAVVGRHIGDALEMVVVPPHAHLKSQRRQVANNFSECIR